MKPCAAEFGGFGSHKMQIPLKFKVFVELHQPAREGCSWRWFEMRDLIFPGLLHIPTTGGYLGEGGGVLILH